MKLKKIIQMNVRNTILLIGAGVMMFAGVASLQSCSINKYTTEKAKLEIVTYNKNKDNKYTSVTLVSKNNNKIGYNLEFKKPLTEKEFLKFESGKDIKIKIKKENLEQALQLLENDKNILFIGLDAKMKK